MNSDLKFGSVTSVRSLRSPLHLPQFKMGLAPALRYLGALNRLIRIAVGAHQ